MPRSVIHENSTTSGDSDSATWHERIADDERPTGPASSIACRATL